MNHPCGCRVENHGPRDRYASAGTTVMDLQMVYCPLHAAAPTLLAALSDALACLNDAVRDDPESYAEGAVAEAVTQSRQAIANAEGRG